MQMVERYNAILTRLKEGPISEVVVRASDYDADLAAARAENERLKAKNEQLGRDLNQAKYGDPDFAWSTHKAAMAELMDHIEKAETESDIFQTLLQRAVDLIKGDLTGSEWKRACHAFVKDAMRALKGEQ